MFTLFGSSKGEGDQITHQCGVSATAAHVSGAQLNGVVDRLQAYIDQKVIYAVQVVKKEQGLKNDEFTNCLDSLQDQITKTVDMRSCQSDLEAVAGRERKELMSMMSSLKANIDTLEAELRELQGNGVNKRCEDIMTHFEAQMNAIDTLKDDVHHLVEREACLTTQIKQAEECSSQVTKSIASLRQDFALVTVQAQSSTSKSDIVDQVKMAQDSLLVDLEATLHGMIDSSIQAKTGNLQELADVQMRNSKEVVAVKRELENTNMLVRRAVGVNDTVTRLEQSLRSEIESVQDDYRMLIKQSQNTLITEISNTKERTTIIMKEIANVKDQHTKHVAELNGLSAKYRRFDESPLSGAVGPAMVKLVEEERCMRVSMIEAEKKARAADMSELSNGMFHVAEKLKIIEERMQEGYITMQAKDAGPTDLTHITSTVNSVNKGLEQLSYDHKANVKALRLDLDSLREHVQQASLRVKSPDDIAKKNIVQEAEVENTDINLRQDIGYTEHLFKESFSNVTTTIETVEQKLAHCILRIDNQWKDIENIKINYNSKLLKVHEKTVELLHKFREENEQRGAELQQQIKVTKDEASSALQIYRRDVFRSLQAVRQQSANLQVDTEELGNTPVDLCAVVDGLLQILSGCQVQHIKPPDQFGSAIDFLKQEIEKTKIDFRTMICKSKEEVVAVAHSFKVEVEQSLKDQSAKLGEDILGVRKNMAETIAASVERERAQNISSLKKDQEQRERGDQLVRRDIVLQVEKHISEIRTTVDSVAKQQETCKSQIREYAKKVDALTADIGVVHKDINDVRAEFVSLHSGMNQNIQQVLDTTKQLGLKDGELEHQIQIVHRHLEEIRCKLDQAIGSTHTLTQRIESSEGCINDMDRVLNEVLQGQKELHDKLHPLSNDVGCCVTDISTLSGGVRNLQARLVDLGKDVQAEKRERTEMQHGLAAEIEETSKRLHAMIKRLQEIDAVRRDLKILRTDFEEEQNSVRCILTEHEQATKQVNSTSEDLLQWQSSQLDMFEKNQQSINQVTQQEKKDFATLKSKIADVTTSLEEIGASVQELIKKQAKTRQQDRRDIELLMQRDATTREELSQTPASADDSVMVQRYHEMLREFSDRFDEVGTKIAELQSFKQDIPFISSKMESAQTEIREVGESISITQRKLHETAVRVEQTVVRFEDLTKKTEQHKAHFEEHCQAFMNHCSKTACIADDLKKLKTLFAQHCDSFVSQCNKTVCITEDLEEHKRLMAEHCKSFVNECNKTAFIAEDLEEQKTIFAEHSKTFENHCVKTLCIEEGLEELRGLFAEQCRSYENHCGKTLSIEEDLEEFTDAAESKFGEVGERLLQIEKGLIEDKMQNKELVGQLRESIYNRVACTDREVEETRMALRQQCQHFEELRALVDQMTDEQDQQQEENEEEEKMTDEQDQQQEGNEEEEKAEANEQQEQQLARNAGVIPMRGMAPTHVFTANPAPQSSSITGVGVAFSTDEGTRADTNITTTATPAAASGLSTQEVSGPASDTTASQTMRSGGLFGMLRSTDATSNRGGLMSRLFGGRSQVGTCEVSSAANAGRALESGLSHQSERSGETSSIAETVVETMEVNAASEVLVETVKVDRSAHRSRPRGGRTLGVERVREGAMVETVEVDTVQGGSAGQAASEILVETVEVDRSARRSRLRAGRALGVERLREGAMVETAEVNAVQGGSAGQAASEVLVETVDVDRSARRSRPRVGRALGVERLREGIMVETVEVDTAQGGSAGQAALVRAREGGVLQSGRSCHGLQSRQAETIMKEVDMVQEEVGTVEVLETSAREVDLWQFRSYTMDVRQRERLETLLETFEVVEIEDEAISTHVAELVLRRPIQYRPHYRGQPPIADFADPAAAVHIVSQLAEFMFIFPGAVLRVEGCTATPPDMIDEWATMLAQRRADSVVGTLLSCGVGSERIIPLACPGAAGSGGYEVSVKLVSWTS